MAKTFKQFVNENVVQMKKGWGSDDHKYQATKNHKITYDTAHQVMTDQEYLANRHKIGKHEYNPKPEGNSGEVAIRLTGESK